jgi:hypothetical protein
MGVAGFGFADSGGDFGNVVLDYSYAFNVSAKLGCFCGNPVGVCVLDFAD